MSVPVGTTPNFQLQFDQSSGVDLTSAVNVYVTFRNGLTTLTKTGDDLEVQALSISTMLSQEETLSFHQGATEIQANWTTADGRRIATEVVYYDFDKQLLMRVIE